MLHRPLALAALLLVIPLCAASGETHDVDHRLTLEPGEPAGEAPPLSLQASEPGERHVWQISLDADYTTFELRILPGAFDVERPRQVVPTLEVEGVDYPLFHPFPHERIWEVDSPARVFHVHEHDGAIVLRLGIPGPANGTLALARDVTPPAYELGEVANVTHFSFYQETRTDELALADLQVREKGTSTWVENPTPVFHLLQRFPIQGLDPDTEYEARVVFEDWAGNEAVTPLYTIRSAPAPARPEPVVTPIGPAPNATVKAGVVVIKARIESPESPLGQSGVRVFLDKREVREGWVLVDGNLSFFPPEPLAPGRHTISVEAVNEAGGQSYAQWAFYVEGANEAPAAGAVMGAAVAVGVALLLARRR